ncbi:GNAT family N-acetyltransferase [Sporosarcina gallistercoris]|uniref:GNAT family N-acetyltransferase n=1 Tax=Sporosarcina gallistercoris TaxID=2762245 RepID=A0ABR8PJS5_9BACL|nr:GNAT family N-acetyltransferase [Sporosarcina gallistercoris]MBD7908418.1 GNAT family N-acetyltransferase [Sporosarcina gallistercoris]
MTYVVEPVQDLTKLNIESLISESEEEGYRFLTRLAEDYKDGINTFTEPGEALYCVKDKQGEVVAIGGVNRFPVPGGDPETGRLQRFYVEADERRNGAGSLLLKEIVEHARNHFHELTVKTESSKADAFYRHNGFEFDDSTSETTHRMEFNH